MRLRFLLVVLVLLSISFSLFAKKRIQEVNFEDDLLVDGKYHFSSEGVVTVEQDKILDALLKLRKNFKDRIARTANHY